MRVGIIGSGALACLFAGRLAELAEVVMVGSWREQLHALQTGLSVLHSDGHITRRRFQVTDDPHQAGRVDVALILVKSYQTPIAVARTTAILADFGPAVTFQNGMGNLELLAEALGDKRATLGVTSQGATVVRPGVIREAGAGPTYLAQPPVLAQRLGGVVAYLRAAGFELHLVADATSLMWGKLAVNAGINALTALLRVPNGFLIAHPLARQIMEAAALETEAVAAAQGIRLPYAAQHSAAVEAARVVQATASNYSSMLQDHLRGAPTEIDAINGAIAAAGRRSAVPTPVNTCLWRWMKQVEAGQPITTWELPLQGQMIDVQTLIATAPPLISQELPHVGDR